MTVATFSRVFLLLLGGLAALPLAAAEILRWQDAEGKVHFGDRPPPPGVRAEAVVPKQTNQSLPPSRAEPTDPPAAPSPLPLTAPVVERSQCERARREVVVLATQRPIYRDETGTLRVKRGPGRTDAYGGERRYLEDAERASELARAETAFARDCAAWPDLQDRRAGEEALFREENCAAARAALADANRPDAANPADLQARYQREVAQWCTPP